MTVIDIINEDVVVDDLVYRPKGNAIRYLKHELEIARKREEIAVACLCRLREQGNEDAIQTLEELLVR